MKAKASVVSICIALLLFLVNSAVTAETSEATNIQLLLGKSLLKERYLKYKNEKKISRNNVNFSITSLMENNTSTGHAFSVINHKYSNAVKLLTSMENWCLALILNVNIKTCTYEQQSINSKFLSLYVEDEHYVPPKNANHIRYQFDVVHQEKDYLYVKMDAKDGPYDTGDYLFIVEIIPLDDNRSFIHLSYSAHFGLISRIILNTYLVTIGRNKIGFTIVDQNKDGPPKYIQGIKAIMERNTARYLLAFEAYLDTLNIDQEDRLMASLRRWHSYTKLFKTQLYELNESDYVSNKQREFENQQDLQRKLFAN